MNRQRSVGASRIALASGDPEGSLAAAAQSQQLYLAAGHRQGVAWALVETFETLVRPWNIEGTSVRPFHRMVAHTGFITVARRVVPEEGGGTLPRLPLPERDE